MKGKSAPEEILRHPALERFLSRHSGPRSNGCLLAVFDCDGTIIKGDIGERMFFRQIDRLFFRLPPSEIWTDHPDRRRLAELYRSITAQGEPERGHSEVFQEFASLLLTRYFDQIRNGDVVKACADVTRLFAGFTIDEVRGFADQTFRDEVASPVGTRILGGRTLPRGIRYIRETVDIFRALAARNFEIYAISGSNRWSVEQVFGRLGLASERVIAIDLEDDAGVLSSRAKEPVPIHTEKVIALGMATPCQPLIAISDSQRDLPLLLSASELKVRINSRGRDTDAFFSQAQVPRDDSWVLVEQPTTMSQIPNG